jgi:hypothetical protein
VLAGDVMQQVSKLKEELDGEMSSPAASGVGPPR